MELSPDQTIFWQNGFITINLTLVTTWGIMLLLIISAVLLTRKLKTDIHISRWQCFLEMIVTGINEQIKEVGLNKPEEYIGFIGTLFLFIGFSNICIIFPGYTPPTASLSTTTALALCVFLAVPFYGISKHGIFGYLKSFLQPTWIMLPFNIIGEVSRTLALAVRLFGNIMSGGMIIAILLTISPFIFPVLMKALGLLTGTVQAYIFSILATVYIAAAVRNANENTKTKIKITK
ncbi:F0F1 ATP synthase subunit A [Kaistella jeonii]|uniref:ATP synthase subunit a n=1 Tax=Kaistella jeonii TaxID=266749 RepID=A0A0C1CX38_9FLAO|nr:F0F1 ATP synthase subunit A [Kaistella jeonii]KIA86010.1 ATP synthase F0F1 subunit A [Kaistella jeonii]SFC37004.1 F-type H+-transporting ATPase subunit a [Kaistella jeonii]VEI97274.1 F-ATPase subunit 6 [Kaistella jeonii]